MKEHYFDHKKNLKKLFGEILLQYNLNKVSCQKYLLKIVSPNEGNKLAQLKDGCETGYFEEILLHKKPVIKDIIDGHKLEIYTLESQMICKIEFFHKSVESPLMGVLYFDLNEHINYIGHFIKILNGGLIRNAALFIGYASMLLVNKERIYYLIEMYSDMMRIRDVFMPFHMMNVANWVMKIGQGLGLSEEDLYILTISALMHDIGKLHISESILNKPGKLTAVEYNHIKTHSVKSYKLAKVALFEDPTFKDVPLIIRHHHERYDGRGYPDGISGKAIPYLARILTVADAIDAMLSRRSYKKSMTRIEIIKELNVNKGSQFDPEMIDIAVNVLERTLENNSFFTNKSLFVADVLLEISGSCPLPVHQIYGDVINKESIFDFIPREEIEHLDLLSDCTDKATVACFCNQEMMEYKVNILSIKKNIIKFTLGSEISSDKLISTTLSEGIKLTIGEAVFEVEIIEIGTSHVKILINSHDLVQEVVGEGINVFVEMDFSDDVTTLAIKEELTITKIYRFTQDIIVTMKFKDLSIRNKEMIMQKILFLQTENDK